MPGPARTARRRRGSILAVVVTVVVVVVVAAALLGSVGYRSSATSTFTGVTTAAPSRPPGRRDPQPRDPSGALVEADGAVPGGVTVFDDQYPAVAKLDPALRRALRQAATDAAHDGVELSVTSGWRSPTYQQRLLREAIAKYGSEHEAARWVATPETSAHVSGHAVDLGPPAAAAWLFEHGARYGLCRTYRNEMWHFELRTEAVEHGCPPMYADASHDPRMQQ